MGSMGEGGARIVVLLMRPGLAQDAGRLRVSPPPVPGLCGGLAGGMARLRARPPCAWGAAGLAGPGGTPSLPARAQPFSPNLRRFRFGADGGGFGLGLSSSCVVAVARSARGRQKARREE